MGLTISAETFLTRVYALIGKPYKTVVCDAVIRQALNINFKGTNWLFRSINNSHKYRYLIERHACNEGIAPPSGAVVFKVNENKTPNGYTDPPDAYHCGVVDTDGYVIHSSPKTGVRKDSNSRWDDWDYWGLMKQVDYDSHPADDAETIAPSNELSSMTDRDILEAIYTAVVRD